MISDINPLLATLNGDAASIIFKMQGIEATKVPNPIAISETQHQTPIVKIAQQPNTESKFFPGRIKEVDPENKAARKARKDVAKNKKLSNPPQGPKPEIKIIETPAQIKKGVKERRQREREERIALARKSAEEEKIRKQKAEELQEAMREDAIYIINEILLDENIKPFAPVKYRFKSEES